MIVLDYADVIDELTAQMLQFEVLLWWFIVLWAVESIVLLAKTMLGSSDGTS